MEPAISYTSEYQFWACQEKKKNNFNFSWELGGPPGRAWPLPSHFHRCPLVVAIYQDPGRGHLSPAHKCMEQAIKLTLWQLFSHPFDGPMSANPLQWGRTGGGGYLNRGNSCLIIESQPDRSPLGSHRKDRELVDLCLETLKSVRSVEDYPE